MRAVQIWIRMAFWLVPTKLFTLRSNNCGNLLKLLKHGSERRRWADRKSSKRVHEGEPPLLARAVGEPRASSGGLHAVFAIMQA
jgi:hypothetical protein